MCFRNDANYSLAGPMCRLLSYTLRTSSVDRLRQVPATNLIFRRSRNTKVLNMSPTKAASESAPLLRKILQAVNPRVVLLVSRTAYDLFVAEHCERGSIMKNAEPQIFTPNGRSNACIFLSAQARVKGLDRVAPLFVVGHPSKYAGRAEWPKVLDALRQGFEKCGICPIDESAFVAVEPLPAYGSSV